MRPIASFALGLSIAAPLPAAADADPDVWTYAKSCFERLHLDANDLSGPFDCTKGKRLVSTVEGVVQDRDLCQGESCAKDIPETCDYGTWLDYQCYGHSFIQVVPTPSNANVKAALLCRHKTRWAAGPAPLLGPDGKLTSGFDDIAMIVHNKENGETCWFQSDEGGDAHLDGLSVPGPATVRDHRFWYKPVDTRGVTCIKCHDSGPWMNSRWMNNAIGGELAGDQSNPLKGPYKNSEPPFDTWPKPVFVELADDDTCTQCHHIAAAHPGVDGADSLGGPDFHTCDEWIRRATGWPHPKASAKGHSFEVTYWMPQGHGLESVDEWSKTYRDKVERIIGCCKAAGAHPDDPSVWPPGCEKECPRDRVDGKCPAEGQ
jgi:hypothetical protein